jgi:anti-sigma B factor antagonist
MITVAEKQGVGVARVTVPRLDAVEAPSFRAAAADIGAPGGRLLLDLTEVEFVDSTGLGAVVSLMKSLGPTGEFCVAGARPAVMRLFALTRLDRVIRIYPDVEAALTELHA